MAKGKLNFKQLVDRSLKCGELPIVAWRDPLPVSHTAIVLREDLPDQWKHIEAKPGDTGCDKSNFKVWRTKAQIRLHTTMDRLDFMTTCLECGAVMAVHADIWKDMRS